MRQAQSYRPRPSTRASRPHPTAGAWGGPSRFEVRARRNPVAATLGFLFGAAWSILTFPFRLVFGAIALLGRLTGVAVGFTLMVVGMALGAGPFFLIGIPIFLVGLLLTMRSLG